MSSPEDLPPPPGEGPPTPLQAEEVAAVLSRHDVDYLVVGGFAMQAHGSHRTTQDLDLVVDNSRENLERLAGALGDLGAELKGFQPGLPKPDLTDRRTIEQLASVRTETKAGDLDIFIGPSMMAGAGKWEDMLERSVATTIGGTQVRVVGSDDLIGLKRATANLPQRPPEKVAVDRKDIDVLVARREDLERAAKQFRQRKPPSGPERGIDR